MCIFYCQAYNESNVAELTKRIEEMKDVDICYLEDPTEPILASLPSMNSYPSRYRRYPAVLIEKTDFKKENRGKT